MYVRVLQVSDAVSSAIRTYLFWSWWRSWPEYLCVFFLGGVEARHVVSLGSKLCK
jgi:hypothetical protein